MNGAFLPWLAIALFTLGGCESIQEIDRAAGEYAKAIEARQAAGRRSGGRMSGAERVPRCEQVSGRLVVPVDPDTAYVRLKRYFGFNTPREAQRTYPNPDWLKYTQYRHETLPGVRYAMSESVVWPDVGRVWLNLEIEKEGRGSRIAWSHCRDADGWEKLGDPAEVQRRLAVDVGRVAGGGR